MLNSAFHKETLFYKLIEESNNDKLKRAAEDLFRVYNFVNTSPSVGSELKELINQSNNNALKKISDELFNEFQLTEHRVLENICHICHLCFMAGDGDMDYFELDTDFHEQKAHEEMVALLILDCLSIGRDGRDYNGFTLCVRCFDDLAKKRKQFLKKLSSAQLAEGMFNEYEVVRKVCASEQKRRNKK